MKKRKFNLGKTNNILFSIISSAALRLFLLCGMNHSTCMASNQLELICV